jgi:glycogen operon protein
MNALTKGLPYPLGSYFDGNGTNFAVASANCSKVELCLFDDTGNEERINLPHQEGEIWYGYVTDCRPGQRYGFRFHGPYAPTEGHRFNPNKLVFDPYSRQLSGPLKESPLLFVGDDQPDGKDSGPVVPKSIVHHESYDWQGDVHPRVPLTKTVIYEAHIKGLTKLHPDIPKNIRGSYAALGHPAIIDYLKNLGVTTIELLPIFMHANEGHLKKHKLTNYWGYNTLAPFTLEPGYWSHRKGTTPLSELRDSIKALHKAGLEVILDVVFNHTAELDVNGPTVCLRGVDNASYYWSEPNGYGTNWSGCGNSIKANNPLALRWIMDCLRYWINECHVDGYRFDLGSILGRNPEFAPDAPLLVAMRQDPVVSQSKLIMEPWDIGIGGYQLGAFHSPFSEWNASFRDDMRRFWLHHDVTLADFARCFAGSSNLFHHHGRMPQASINFLTAHDGFTLRDLVSFNDKHNEANGEDNNDGNNSNFSFNHGAEGLEADEDVLARRSASQRALLATLLLSQGIPMLLAGDEMGHSQRGNNNAYCQDNEITWLDWQSADNNLIALCRSLTQIRQQIVSLNISAWWTNRAEDESGITDAHWRNQHGEEISPDDWNNLLIRTLQICLADKWILLINASDDDQTYQLPEGIWYQQASSVEQENHGSEQQHTAPAQSITVLRHQSEQTS